MEYTEKQRATLEKLEELIKTKPSQKETCRIIGISDGVISPLRKGIYSGDIDKIFSKLDDYFDIKEKNSQLPVNISTEYVETSVSGEIYDIISLCQVKGGLAIACGDAGIGKTKAVIKFRKDHPNSSIAVTMNTCSTSVKSLLRLIAAQTGSSYARSNDEMLFSIISKLSDGMVLIVDEAQFLTLSQIEALRSISDYFADRDSTLGVALVGNPEIVSKMGSRRNEYSQIINRCEITKIYRTGNILRTDIQKLFPAISENEREIDFLWKISKTIQGIRGVVKLYNTARQNENCTFEGLVAVAEQHMNIRTGEKI
jgi:DNA transposition AAA+ family ATPase